MFKRIVIYGWLILMAGCLIFAVYMFYSTANNANVVEIYNLPYPVNQTVYQPGDTLFFTSEFCKFRDVPATSQRLLVRESDGLSYDLGTTVLNLPPNCKNDDDRQKFVVEVQIPESIEPGMYRLRGFVSHDLNLFATIKTESYTEVFKIIE